MPLYETVWIARQDVAAAQVEQLAQGFTEIIEQNGGKVTKTEFWGLKSFAYKIRKNRKGHYVLFNIDAPHAAVAEMERLMGISEDVLRVLTIRVEEHEEGPSAMMQSRHSRDRDGRDRDGRDRGDRDRGDRRDRAPRDAAPQSGQQSEGASA